MIDNIILRLHGCNQQLTDKRAELLHDNKKLSLQLCPEHHELYLKMLNFKGKHFEINKHYVHQKASKNALKFEEHLTSETSKKLNEHFISINKAQFVSYDKIKDRTLKANGKYHVPSSESDTVFSINPEGGFIEFNINLNKYLYGHNLAQFVPQIDSYRYTFSRGNFDEWSVQKSYLFERLTEFIENFLLDLFYFFEIGMLPNYDYIELNRIDLSYNQYFESKSDALQYLEYQKKIKKKTSREQQKRTGAFDTTIQYNTQSGFNFKIYHKGTEYTDSKHGDFKKHNKINRLQIEQKVKLNTNTYFKENYIKVLEMFKNDTIGEIFKPYKTKKFSQLTNEIYKDLPFNTMFYKAEMDKILRYEISLKSNALARLFKLHIFRSKCSIHKKHFEIYKTVKRSLKSVNDKYKPSKYEYNIYKKMHHFLNTSGIMLLSNSKTLESYAKTGFKDYNLETRSYDIPKLYNDLNKGSLLETRHVLPFNNQFLKLLVDQLKKLIDYYQIKEIQPYDDLVKRVQNFNEQAKAKREQYNKLKDHLTWTTEEMTDIRGKKFKIQRRKQHRGKIIKKAHQLLTEAQLREKGFKTVNVTNLTEIFRLIHDEKLSIHQVKKRLKMQTRQFNRRIQLFKMVGLDVQFLNITKVIKTSTSFFKYYSKMHSKEYKANFFPSKLHFQFDTHLLNQRITITQYKQSQL